MNEIKLREDNEKCNIQYDKDNYTALCYKWKLRK